MREKVKVYVTQLEGYCGPVVWRTAMGVIGELEELLEEMGVGDSFTVTVEEIETEELDALPEFAGY